MTNYNCTICNKEYKSYSSLWNHNKKFHKGDGAKNFSCKYCGDKFSHRQSKYNHEKKFCKRKPSDNTIVLQEIEKLKEEVKKIKQNKELNENKEIEKLKEENKKLKEKPIFANPTLKTIKKLLNNRKSVINTNNCNNTTNSNNNSNNKINNILNNNYIVNFGSENVLDKLTMKQKTQIMNSKWNCIDKLIEITNCGEYNEFKNIMITNLKDNEVYIYDATSGNFVTRNKSETLNNLIDNRIGDIEAVYDELSAINKINESTKQKIEDFLEKIRDEDTKFMNENVTYDNYKSYKMHKIKILLYDNNDNITKDLAVYLS